MTNAFNSQTLESLVAAWGWTLAHFMWQGSCVAACAWLSIVLPRGGSPQLRDAALLAWFALLAACPLFTFVLEVQRIAVVPPLTISGPDFSRSATGGGHPPGRMAARNDSPRIRSKPRLVIEGPGTAAGAIPASGFGVVTHGRPAPLLGSPMPVWLACGWGLGVAACVLRLTLAYWGLRRVLTNRARPLRKEWIARVELLARRLAVQGPVRWLESASFAVPFTLGWLRPVVVVPAGVLTNLTFAEVECLIAHELAHIRRHDYLVNLLQCLMETLFFYHPAVWWLSSRIRRERELICDELAVRATGDRMAYSRALLAVAELSLPPAQLSLAAAHGDLRERVRRILGLPAAAARVSPTTVLMLILLGLGTGAILVNTQLHDRGSNSHTPPAAVPATVETFSEGKHRLPPIAGRIVNEDGVALAGVRVYVRESHGGYRSGVPIPDRARDLAFVLTDSAGRFRFEDVPTDDSREPFDVVAVAEGYAFAWRHFPSFVPQPEVKLVMHPERRLQGVVEGADGRPIAGAAVQLRFAMSMRHITQADLELGRWPRQDDDNYANAFGFRDSPQAVTDAAGRFELTGLPANRGLVLGVEHPYYESVEAFVATVEEIDAENAARAKRLVQTGRAQVNLGEPKPPRLEISFDSGGRPVIAAPYAADFTVRSGDRVGRLIVEPTAESRFQSPTAIAVHVVPPTESPYMEFNSTAVAAPDGPVLVELERGTPISGRVVDSATGEGVGDVTISIMEHSGLVGLHAGDRLAPRSYAPRRVVTAADGSFRFLVRRDDPFVPRVSPPPGFEVSGLPTDDHPAALMRAESSALFATADEPVSDWILKLDRVPLHRIAVTDPQGQPAVGVTVTGQLTLWDTEAYMPGNSFVEIDEVTDADGIVLLDLHRAWKQAPPEAAVDLAFRSWQDHLGARLSLTAADHLDAIENRHSVQLQPLGGVTGRFVNAQTRQPVIGRRVSLSRHNPSQFGVLSPAGPGMRTDDDGRFELSGVDDDSLYRLNLGSDKRFQGLNRADRADLQFMGRPGERVDLGDVFLTPAN